MNLGNIRNNIGSQVRNVSSAVNNPIWQERLITWGAPAALIPTFRFFNDNEKEPELRKELFLRDATSFSVGTGVYFATLATVDNLKNDKKLNKTFEKVPEGAKKIFPVGAAVLAYSLWSGFCGPKFSKWCVHGGKKDALPKPVQPKKFDMKEPDHYTFETKTVINIPAYAANNAKKNLSNDPHRDSFVKFGMMRNNKQGLKC